MEEQTATEPTEENTCSTVHDLIDNELRFRDMCLPKVSAEHAKRFFLKNGATEEFCASHGQNVSPTRSLTCPTQNPLSLMESLRGDWISMVA